MSDFTKEELQYILQMIDSISIVNRQVHEDELQEKIQSMIDNYCEHEFYDHKRLGSVCKKCGDLEE